VVAVVLQEASLKMGPNLSLKCSVFQYVQWRMSGKWVRMSCTIVRSV